MPPAPAAMSAPRESVLYENEAFRLTSRALIEPGLRAELSADGAALCIAREGQGVQVVALPQLPSEAAQLRSSIPVLQAMYRMAAHELEQDITPEGLMLAGAAWSTVWTRDIAYAAALGASLAAPEACRRSLESRVRGGIILQDTGTGGGWPVSTDRVAWAIGAWMLFVSTGDRAWLSWVVEVLEATLEQDELLCPEGEGAVPGETSFIDWREQSYPDWMKPADIAASYAFGTNVVHYAARRLLASMLRVLGRGAEAAVYAESAARLAKDIDSLFWSRATCRYGMFRTADGCLDERVDALATALAVHCGLAGEHASQVMRSLPCSPYGTPVFSPYKASQPAAYHNRACWPFVESFVLLAHADLLDTARAARSMAFMLRAAMAFGSNKENLHAESGEAGGTIQNSDRQLWSVAGMLGLFYYGLFGIQYEGENLVLAPCVPRAFAGSHWLTGLRIRKMVLSIHLNGYGTEVCSVMVNGKAGSPFIPLDSVGLVQVELELNPADDDEAAPCLPAAAEDLPEPQWDEPTRELLRWHPVPGAASYTVYANGSAITNTAACSLPLGAHRRFYDEYRVQAVNAVASSCLSRPFECAADVRLLQPYRIGMESEYEVEHRQAWLDTRSCTSRLDYEAVCVEAGRYRLRVLYCNATASLRDGDTCALRELMVDGTPVGMVVMPHNTEAGRWEDYTLSTPLTLELGAGRHRFSLCFTPRCRNAHGAVNQCMVRHLELVRLA